ncbi:hypothetical protein NEF87_002532 [Candidatus Lokiarchaeum ossiferum]|uniref:Core-binding (CB) domain-containing protein n=1 Tax=Candidatus Lokiarchaeum ossiferum TaxID=2951803 RepID=A0ABY6HRV5_9ARCH|nr:hypothetical protein NEF87_002532 [Candidatus Lokiarchaeum sp. B-35]
MILTELEGLMPIESQELVQSYLTKKLRTGKGTESGYRSAITRFLKYINIYDVTQINRIDAENYLNYLDTHPNNFKESSKRYNLSILHSFFDQVEDYYRSQNIAYFNPIPKLKHYKFTPDRSLTLDERDAKKRDAIFTIAQLKTINEIYRTLCTYENWGFRIESNLFIHADDMTTTQGVSIIVDMTTTNDAVWDFGY